ncbi:hypothetical protein B0T14DRAFT_527400, partial [Immersiella caudata]
MLRQWSVILCFGGAWGTISNVEAVHGIPREGTVGVVKDSGCWRIRTAKNPASAALRTFSSVNQRASPAVKG